MTTPYERIMQAVDKVAFVNNLTAEDLQTNGPEYMRATIVNEAFALADTLLAKGAPLPELEKTRKDFDTLQGYFGYLTELSATNEGRLYVALAQDPTLLNKQDESGNTLLHHASCKGPYSVSPMRLLFYKNADPNIMNNISGTPLHQASYSGDHRYTVDYVFMPLLEYSVKHNFDFTKLNRLGQTVMHIAARTNCSDYLGMFLKNNTYRLLAVDSAKESINVLSSSGSTAFYYAVDSGNFPIAAALLHNGANPLLFGKPDRDPLQRLDVLFKKLETERFTAARTTVDKLELLYPATPAEAPMKLDELIALRKLIEEKQGLHLSSSRVRSLSR